MTNAKWAVPAAFAAGLLLAMGLGAGRDQLKTPTAWEYGRLYITQGTAVLETQTSICKVELPISPPENMSVYRSSKGLFERKWNPQFYAINVFGQDGWEVDPGSKFNENEPYFVRRAR